MLPVTPRGNNKSSCTLHPARSVCTLHPARSVCTLHDLVLAARRPIHTSRTRTRILVTPTPLINRPTPLISAEIPGSPAPTPVNPADWVAPPSDWPRSRPVRADFALSPECSAYPGMPARPAHTRHLRSRARTENEASGHAAMGAQLVDENVLRWICPDQRRYRRIPPSQSKPYAFPARARVAFLLS